MLHKLNILALLAIVTAVIGGTVIVKTVDSAFTRVAASVHTVQVSTE